MRSKAFTPSTESNRTEKGARVCVFVYFYFACVCVYFFCFEDVCVCFLKFRVCFFYFENVWEVCHDTKLD